MKYGRNIKGEGDVEKIRLEGKSESAMQDLQGHDKDILSTLGAHWKVLSRKLHDQILGFRKVTLASQLVVGVGNVCVEWSVGGIFFYM